MSETQTSTGSDRHVLAQQHLDLPRRIAQTLHPRCQRYIDLDELIALGNVGLSEAASRFDASTGIPFRAFASYRVRGAMLDGLRRHSPLPRRVWQRIVALRGAADYLEHCATSDPATVSDPCRDNDVAATLTKVRAALASVRTVYLTSLSVVAIELEPSETRRVDDELDHRRNLRDVATAAASLPRRECDLVFKCYWEGKDLATAGAELGMSKSGASRVHARAVQRLRDWHEQTREPITTAPAATRPRFAA